MPNLKKGLDKAGRKRSDFDLNVWLYVAPSEDRKEAIDETRRTVIFYALHSQYEKYFAANGFGKEARAIAEASRAKDETAHAASLHGRDGREVRHRRPHRTRCGGESTASPRSPIRSRSARRTSRCPPERIGFYNEQIAKTFYL